MSDAFIGEIRPFITTFAPYGWFQCNGQLVSLQQYQALYSIIGTRYGGDGKTTFAVPNLQGTVLVGTGQQPVPGSSNWVMGPTPVGTEKVALNSTQMPAHNHNFNGVTGAGAGRVASIGTGTSWLTNLNYTPQGGGAAVAANPFVATTTPTVVLPSATLAPSFGNAVGGADPHENRSPYVTVSYYISALDGYYPVKP